MTKHSKISIVGNKYDISGNIQRASLIFFEYSDFIRSVIRYRIYDKSRIEDLYQDFFLSLVLRPIPSSVRNIKSYIYRVISCDIKDQIRQHGRSNTLKNEYAGYHSQTITAQTPDSTLMEKEQTDRIIEFIRERVTKSEAKAIVLRYRDNLSIKETADRMGVNNRSVSRYISAGLGKVRKYLKNQRAFRDERT